MSARVQSKPNTPSYAIYHQGLIKVMILHELNKDHHTWDHFLFWGGFQYEIKRSQDEQNKALGKKEKTLRKHKKIIEQSSPVKQETNIITRGMRMILLEEEGITS